MRLNGKLVVWDDHGGYGFIAPEHGDMQVFVHISGFIEGSRRPVGGEALTYEVGTDQEGRPRAVRVRLAGAPKTVFSGRHKRKAADSALYALAALFALLMSGAVALGVTPVSVGGLYLVASTAALAFYGWDKRAAQQEAWRVPELRLHLLALIGGWPGALVGQRLFHHKSSKASFLVVFWITLLLNCSALVWLHTGAGKHLLQGLGIAAQTVMAKGESEIPQLLDRAASGADALRGKVYRCADGHGGTLYSDRPCP